VILITVDCLRADHVGFNGYSRPTTPFLDSLATESLVFSNAIVAGTPTYYSFPATMASRYPLDLGREVVGLAPGEPTIATQLKSAGYATAAFLAGNPYLSPRFGYDFGFDVFRDFLDEEISPHLVSASSNGGSGLNRSLNELSHRFGMGSLYDELYFRYCQRKAPSVDSMSLLRRFPAADAMIDEARSWIASVEAPFFLWLHLMDPHSPYYPPEEALALMDDDVSPQHARYLNSYWNRGLPVRRFASRRPQINALYDAGIRWMDKHVGRLVESLRESQRWQNCVFALTADHGEEFLDHGGRYHAPSKLTEELIRVPLLLCVPGANKIGRMSEPFSLLHLAPTLLEAARVEVPPEFKGHSHWRHAPNDAYSREAAIVECIAGCTNPFRRADRLNARILAVREARYKIVLDFQSDRDQMFDLEKDPAEYQSVPENVAMPERRRLLEAARQHIQRSLEDRDPMTQLKARLKEFRAGYEFSN
jgi:arylsulfatase A-like enzyme